MSAPVDHPGLTGGPFVHYAETIFKSTACGTERFQTAAADEKVFRVATKTSSDLAEVTCPDCVRRALAPEMERLLREQVGQCKGIDFRKAGPNGLPLVLDSCGKCWDCRARDLLARLDEARRG